MLLWKMYLRMVNFTHQNWLILELYEAVDQWWEFFRRFLDGALVRTLQRKRSLCSRKSITVKGFVEIWKFKVIEVWRWAYDVLLLKLKLRVAIWLEDVFSPASKKILPKVPRKYGFNLKKSRPDGLHTTIPPRSSTCQQNVRSSQTVSP